MEDSKRDEIVQLYRGKFPSSSFIPWIKVTEYNRDRTLKKTSIHFVDWFNQLSSLIEAIPYGGTSIDCNWFAKYSSSEVISTEFLLSLKREIDNDNRRRCVISKKKFGKPNFDAEFNEMMNIIQWGLVTYNNLYISFASHKKYTDCDYMRMSKSYEEELASSSYTIRKLGDETYYKHTNINRRLSKYLNEDIFELAQYRNIINMKQRFKELP
jgi:hypothetical protein